MTHSPAYRAVSSLLGAVNSSRVEPTPRLAFYTAPRPTASRMVRDTGAILRDGPKHEAALTNAAQSARDRSGLPVYPLDGFTAPSGSPFGT